MIATKLKLSAKEWELVNNSRIILTKNAILEKVKAWLQVLNREQLDFIKNGLRPEPAGIFHSTPKISRGENYQGLPYLVLDYPRVFETEKLPERKGGIAAIRTLFWWGHFFTVTLHLAGIYKKGSEQNILDAFLLLRRHNFYICVNEGQWVHHFEKDNYRPLKKMSYPAFSKIVKRKNFCKLAARIHLAKKDFTLQEKLMTCFTLLAGLVKNGQLPRR